MSIPFISPEVSTRLSEAAAVGAFFLKPVQIAVARAEIVTGVAVAGIGLVGMAWNNLQTKPSEEKHRKFDACVQIGGNLIAHGWQTIL